MYVYILPMYILHVMCAMTSLVYVHHSLHIALQLYTTH